MLKRTIISLIILITVSACFAQSKGAMFLKSMVVPGYSQVRSGRDYGYAMMASEVAIIGSMFYLNNESDVLIQESYEYAYKFAHLSPGDYDNDFYTNLARYESSGFDVNGYNAMIRQRAMAQYPYDPVAQQAYIDANSYGPDKYWSWDSTSYRGEYSHMRNRSQDFEDYAKIVAGVLILNHVISGVDVLRFSAEEKRSHVYFGVKNKNPMLFLSYKW